MPSGPFGGAEQVFRYLGRYSHRVAISNARLLAFEEGRVSFRWRDYADDNRMKVMQLDADEFIRRFLLQRRQPGFRGRSDPQPSRLCCQQNSNQPSGYRALARLLTGLFQVRAPGKKYNPVNKRADYRRLAPPRRAEGQCTAGRSRRSEHACNCLLNEAGAAARAAGSECAMDLSCGSSPPAPFERMPFAASWGSHHLPTLAIIGEGKPLGAHSERRRGATWVSRSSLLLRGAYFAQDESGPACAIERMAGSRGSSRASHNSEYRVSGPWQ